MLHTLRGGPALGQAQLKVIFYCHEKILESHGRPIQETFKESLLVGLEAARHAGLVHTAAPIAQAAVTAVQLRAGRLHAATAVHEQVFPLTNVTQLIRDQQLSLDGVATLVARLGAVPRVELHSPSNGTVLLLHFGETLILECSWFLFKGAAEEVDEGQAEDDPQDPSLAQQPPPHQCQELHHGGPGFETREQQGWVPPCTADPDLLWVS